MVAHHVLIDRRVAVHKHFPGQADTQYTASFVEAGCDWVRRRTGCAGVDCTDRIGSLKKHAKAGCRIDLVRARCYVTIDIAHVAVVLRRCEPECRKCQSSVH